MRRRFLGGASGALVLLILSLALGACGDDSSSEAPSSAGEPAESGSASDTAAEPGPESTAEATTEPDAEPSIQADADATEVIENTSGRDQTIITVSAPLLDPFFSAWAKGTEAAGADLGITSEFTAPANFDNIVTDFQRLLEAAMERADAMVVGDFIPDAFDPLIKQAIDSGIPVVIVNSGEASARELGAIAFVGQDESYTGLRSGEEMISAGVTHGLCIDHVPENPSTTLRCEGFSAAFAAAGLESRTFNLPQTDANNPQAIAQALQGQIASNPGIDGVYTLGSGVAESALQAIEDQGRSDSVALATTDLSTNVLNAIKEGSILFAADQQPYMQGYYGVLIASQYLEYGLQPGAPIRTGPMFVTADNVDAVLKAQEAGVRGAA